MRRIAWPLTLLVIAASLSACGAVGAVARSTSTSSHPSTTVSKPVGMGRPGIGFLPGRITAVGDSVMIDYEALLAKDLPGISIAATVGEQWATGINTLASLRAHDQLGATVIVGLGTNGPVTPTLMASMLSVLHGASRIVLVTEHVDQPWQNQNNALIFATAKSHAHIVVANWYARSRLHPGWFYSDQTHLPPGGVGASHLAWIIRQATRRP